MRYPYSLTQASSSQSKGCHSPIRVDVSMRSSTNIPLILHRQFFFHHWKYLKHIRWNICKTQLIICFWNSLLPESMRQGQTPAFRNSERSWFIFGQETAFEALAYSEAAGIKLELKIGGRDKEIFDWSWPPSFDTISWNPIWITHERMRFSIELYVGKSLSIRSFGSLRWTESWVLVVFESCKSSDSVYNDFLTDPKIRKVEWLQVLVRPLVSSPVLHSQTRVLPVSINLSIRNSFENGNFYKLSTVISLSSHPSQSLSKYVS